MIEEIESKYRRLSEQELEKRLKRKPSKTEIANSDTDSDLINEVFWQIIKEFDARIGALEKTRKEVK